MKNKEADAGNNGSNTFDFLALNQNGFSVSDYDADAENLQSSILGLMKPSKVIRLFPCFGCEKSFTAKKMSTCLVICKACYSAATAQDKGKVARSNFVEKTLNNIHKFLRRRVVCQN